MELDSTRPTPGAALPPAYLSATSSSFSDFLRSQAPELLPRAPRSGDLAASVPHGTTIVALTYSGGVLIAGDRRATSGNVISQRDIDKVFVTDQYSAIAIAGTAGIGLEMARLYSVELQQYEKIEGVSLSLDGKTNRLSTMVRANLDAAFAGLAVLPLFVGYDIDATEPEKAGRIVTYDVTGGRFEEFGGYHSVGSGSVYAKSSMKKLYRQEASAEEAVRTAVEALYDAADDDSATGGPDLVRRIYPTVVTIDGAEGAVKLAESRAAEVAEAVVEDRRQAAQ